MKKANITIIGAGFSGIATAIYLKKAGIDDFQILEKASEAGGTWRDNIYPGVACDVPSVVYSFSFENKHDWSHNYSEGKEILDYLKTCVQKYGISKHIVYNTSIESAEFNNAENSWILETNLKKKIETRFLVLCTGGLSRPKLPNIPGIDSYKGKIIHSAQWDKCIAPPESALNIC